MNNIPQTTNKTPIPIINTEFVPPVVGILLGLEELFPPHIHFTVKYYHKCIICSNICM